MPRARYKSGGASAVKLAGGRSAWDCVALVVLNGTSVAQQGIAPAIVSIRIENGEVFGSLEAIGSIARCLPAELLISKRKLRQAEAVQLVRLKRESASQNVGFASRPFVLCGLPIKRPSKGVLMHERRNGRFLLQVTGHQQYGVPWGQDRLVPIFLATLAMRQQKQTITFRSAAEMLDVFGMQQGGSQYRRLIAAFQRFLARQFSLVPIHNERKRRAWADGGVRKVYVRSDDAEVWRPLRSSRGTREWHRASISRTPVRRGAFLMSSLAEENNGLLQPTLGRRNAIYKVPMRVV
jgi:hypothetical protein